MTIQEGPGGVKTRITKLDYPVVEGLVAGTTKQTGQKRLIAEDGSNVRESEEAGLG